MSESTDNRFKNIKKRVYFDGTNYSRWHQSLLDEAKQDQILAYFDKDVSTFIATLPSAKELVLKDLRGEVSDDERKQFERNLEHVKLNDKALALVNATLRDDFKTVTVKTKLAYESLELIKAHWNQSTVQHREFLTKRLDNLKLDEGKDSILFLLECERLRDQLHDCGDKSLTDSALAEKILGKLPLSMKDLASQIRTNVVSA